MTTAAIAILFISSSALGLELTLIRALSIGHWHHFSYLIISTALLGFAASGTFISICGKTLKARWEKNLWYSAMGMACSVPIVFWLSQKLLLDELQIIWDYRQLFYLFGYYLLFFIPFFFAGMCVGLVFTIRPENAHRLYFCNMAGSGIGAGGIIGLMYGNPPERLLLIISALAFIAALLFAWRRSRASVVGTMISMVLTIFIFSEYGILPLQIEISQNKSLVYYQSLPDAKIPATRYSPLGRIDVVNAPAIRYFPGLSMTFHGELPQQMLIISDGDGISAVSHFNTMNDLTCYDYLTSALAYHLVTEPSVCIIGAGGGSDVAQALALNARHVTAVEMNKQTIEIVRGQLSEFTSGIYTRPGVTVIPAEGRNFLQITHKRFDIINISLLDSFSASAAGLYALNESHLYTIEAFTKALDCLHPRGVLSITRLLKTPPRDSLKILSTAVAALARQGIENPAGHIIFIRNWATATILISPTEFSALQISQTREFCRQRGLDLVHLPGIEPNQANQFDVLETPIHYTTAQQILSPSRESFYRRYIYSIRPATDDRPYFFDFFRWKALPHTIRSLPGRWLPFSEWGYLVLIATLVQAICAGAFLILLPLLVARPIKTLPFGKLPTFIYFLLLGFAYMFLEMGFIQKMTLLIGHPVLGVAVTLAAFLFFSGCGSLAAGRILQTDRITVFGLIVTAAIAIIIVGAGEISIMTFAFDKLVSIGRTARVGTSLIIIAPLAFVMGMPFPSGLARVGTNIPPLVPWAWGVNGFASVAGAVLGTCLAISLGFVILVLIALTAYGFAAIIARPLCREGLQQRNC